MSDYGGLPNIIDALTALIWIVWMLVGALACVLVAWLAAPDFHWAWWAAIAIGWHWLGRFVGWVVSK